MPGDTATFAPLHSTRVVELTTSIAGPYCGLILGVFGADVVKIEQPGRGDDTRAWGPPFWNGESAVFLSVNAGKRSVALDLKTAGGLDAALRLVSTADVVVQNLRPGLAERLGLGFDDVARRNDRVVYCSIGAFGSKGALARDPGYDPLMQAAGGIMSITGEAGGQPVRTGASIVDQGTGMWCAIGILAALRARDAGAGAQLVDTSLYETAVNWIPYQLVGFLASGHVPSRLGSGIGILAPYGAFATSDGFVMIAAGNDRLFATLCDAIGAPDLADDARFRTNAERVEHREALHAAIAERMTRHTASEWLQRLRAAGIPVAPIQDVREVAESEQTRALGLLQELGYGTVPELRLVAPPVSVDGSRVAYAGPPPALGEHSVEVLREVGLDPGEIDALLASGAAEQAS